MWGLFPAVLSLGSRSVAGRWVGPGQGFFPLQAGAVKDQESEGMKHRIRGWTGKEVEAKGWGENSVENREV